MFDDFIGQPPAKALLRRIASSRTLTPVLLEGPEGCGKRTAARLLARDWTGPRETTVDLLDFTLSMDSAEPDGRRYPMSDVHHMLSLAACDERTVLLSLTTAGREVQNSLLKSLEEPPANTHIVIVCTSPSHPLDTIASRCTRVRFGALDEFTLAALAERDDVSAGTQAIKQANGSYTRLLWLLDRPALVDAIEDLDYKVLASDLHTRVAGETTTQTEERREWCAQVIPALIAQRCTEGQALHELAAAMTALTAGVKPEACFARAVLA